MELLPRDRPLEEGAREMLAPWNIDVPGEGGDWRPRWMGRLRESPLAAECRMLPGLVEHTFTHFHLELEVWCAETLRDGVLRDAGDYRWTAREDLAGEALPTVMRKVVAHVLGESPKPKRRACPQSSPPDPNRDTVLTRAERPEWSSSDKSSRRSLIAQDFRILLLIGDDSGDFVQGTRGTLAARKALDEANAEMWGVKWIALPNPMYGSWKTAAGQ